MTTVSDFFGLIVISVFPRRPTNTSLARIPSRRHKSHDALITSDEDSAGSMASYEEVPTRPRSREAHSATPPSFVHHTKPVDHVPRPALGKPDFWILAFIMSMRTPSLSSLSNQRSQRLWFDVYQCWAFHKPYFCSN